MIRNRILIHVEENKLQQQEKTGKCFGKWMRQEIGVRNWLKERNYRNPVWRHRSVTLWTCRSAVQIAGLAVVGLRRKAWVMTNIGHDFLAHKTIKGENLKPVLASVVEFQVHLRSDFLASFWPFSGKKQRHLRLSYFP